MSTEQDDIELVEPTATPDTHSMSDGELTVDDLGGNFLKNPKVGEEITFTVKSVVKNTKNLNPVNPKNQKTMKLALSGVDYNIHINTADGKLFAISAWEVYGKLKAIWKRLANGQKGYTLANQTFRIKHLLNGLLDENKDKDKECYEVAVKRDGKFYTLSRDASEWVVA